MKQRKRPSHAVRQLRNALFAWVVAAAFYAAGYVNRSWIDSIDGLDGMLHTAAWMSVALGVFCAFASLASLTVHQDQKADARSRKDMARNIAKNGASREYR